MQFEEQERVDGCRFSWNVWPNTKLNEGKLSVPLGLLYSPVRQLNELTLAPYKPSFCNGPNCGAILNPYCAVYYDQKIWTCCFCHTRNQFSAQIAQATNEYRAPETLPNSTTMEYTLEVSQQPPVFVFVVDTVLIEEELLSLKDSIKQALLLLPDNAVVGLITYGSHVFLHELSNELISTTHLFPRTKETDVSQLMQRQNLRVHAAGAVGGGANIEQKQADGVEIVGRDRFLAPISSCLMHLNSILDDLRHEQWNYLDSERATRAVGPAVKLAVELLEATYKNHNGRVLTFVGGPGCDAPGAIVDRSLTVSIRSHHDIVREDAPLYNNAVQYYTKVAAMAANNGHTIDLFACCLDQVGLQEMQALVSRTGGCVVLDDSFTRGVFQGSMRRLFHVDADEGTLSMCFGAEMQVLTSNELQIQGAIGHLTSLNRPSKCVSNKPVGIGKTCAWYLGGVDLSSTYALLFTLNDKGAVTLSGQPSQQGYIQIASKFRTSHGHTRVRVTTVSKVFADLAIESGVQHTKLGFDQEASAALITRVALYKLVEEPGIDIRRWVDRILIKLCCQFSVYQQNQANSFKLSQEFELFPQFMFYVRRSQLLQVFNNSPDETAFFRIVCQHEDTNNVVTMLQPRLYSYRLDSHPEPVPLDISSLATDHVLLLDTFFHVVVWFGASVEEWRKNKLHEDPQYQNVAMLLTAPLMAAKERIDNRFPTPRFIQCVEKGSQSRFLLAKQDHSSGRDVGGDEALLSEDVTLKVFYEHLKKLVTERAHT